MNYTDNRSRLAVNELIRELHHRIEAKERIRISQALMAKRLGISARTYLEYLRGTHSPLGMRVILDLLSMLNDDELKQVIQHWKSSREICQPISPEESIRRSSQI